MILGIDPGLNGAFCLLGDDRAVIEIADVPVNRVQRAGKTKREVDPAGVYSEIRRLKGYPMTLGEPLRAVIEASGAMPGQGVTSMFSLGRSFGIIIGVLASLEIPYDIVSANRWKRAVGIPAKSGKDASRVRASQLMPMNAAAWRLVKHDGRAESALIAYYGSKQ